MSVYERFNQAASIQLARLGVTPALYFWIPVFGLCKVHLAEEEAGHRIILEDLSLFDLLNGGLKSQNIKQIKRNINGRIEMVRIEREL